MNPILERLIISLAAGFLLGLERQIHRHPAGLKTHILICTGSTLLMIVSLVLAGALPVAGLGVQTGGDPGRLAAQVVSGIGFLGGGAIIRQGLNIKGLTTAATIWVSSAIGLAIGLGAYYAAGVTLAFILVLLFVLERFEGSLFPVKNIKTLILVFRDEHFDYAALKRDLAKIKIMIGNMDVSKTMDSHRVKISLQVHIPEQIDIGELTETLQKTGQLVKLELTANERPPR